MSEGPVELSLGWGYFLTLESERSFERSSMRSMSSFSNMSERSFRLLLMWDELCNGFATFCWDDENWLWVNWESEEVGMAASKASMIFCSMLRK